jgi:hypothetical protein
MAWQTRITAFLQQSADCRFADWKQTKQGKAWLAKYHRGSPYHAGFSLPEWHHDIIAALGRDDEHECKALMLQNLPASSLVTA